MKSKEKSFNNCRYFEFGSGANLYVLLSGWGTPYALADMYNIAMKLSCDSRVLIIDRYGYDIMDTNVSDRTFKNVCSEIASIIDYEADSEDVIIIGHSLGGAYALYILEVYSHLIKEVILLDMLPYVGSLSSIVYKFNYVPANVFRFLRYSKLINNFSDDKLKVMLRLEGLDDQLVSDTLDRTKTSLYNKNVFNELKYMNSFIKRLKTTDITYETVVKIIVSTKTFELCKKSIPLLSNRYSNLEIYNIGESSHYIHHDKLDDVVEIIKINILNY